MDDAIELSDAATELGISQEALRHICCIPREREELYDWERLALQDALGDLRELKGHVEAVIGAGMFHVWFREPSLVSDNLPPAAAARTAAGRRWLLDRVWALLDGEVL